MEDRHHANYIPFRCSGETSRMISQLAAQRHIPKSEVLRDLVDRGLVSIGAKADDDYLYELVQRVVKETMIVAVTLSNGIILHSIRKKMGTLLDGIQSVAEGNLNVQLNETNAEEYREVYAGFNRMTAELKNTKQEMQSFVNEFSHEFKTPITSISGFAQLLMDTGDGIETPERMQYLKVIADESLRLSTLSQNTLLLSKVDACEIITDKEKYDLSEQIKSCAILLLPKIEQKKLQLELDVDDVSYCGNSELMEQVWINLLSNAIKFTPENGEIFINARQEADGITISFADSGVGMLKKDGE